MPTIVPTSGILLHGASEVGEDVKSGSSPTILVKLSDAMLQDLKKGSHTKEGISFEIGRSPVGRPQS